MGQSLDGHTTQQFDDLKHNIELDGNKRSVVHEKLEQNHRELRTDLEMHAADHTTALQDLEGSFTTLKKVLEKETKIRTDESNQFSSDLGLLSERLERESMNFGKAAAENLDKLRALTNALNTEVRDRSMLNDQSANHA